MGLDVTHRYSITGLFRLNLIIPHAPEGTAGFFYQPYCIDNE